MKQDSFDVESIWVLSFDPFSFLLMFGSLTDVFRPSIVILDLGIFG